MRRIRQPEQTLNVIVADTDWKTFEALADFKGDYNLVNLSSDFAVSFILENEQIDVLIAGKSIARLDDLKKKSEKKKIKMYVLGQDVAYPVNKAEIFAILEYEKNLKFQEIKNNRKKYRINLISRLFEKNNYNNENEEEKPQKNIQNDPFKKDKDTNKTSSTVEDNFFNNFNVLDKNFWDDKNFQGIFAGHPAVSKNGVNNSATLQKQANKKVKDLKILENKVPKNPEELKYLIPAKNPSGNKTLKKDFTKHAKDIVAIKQKIIVFIRAKGGVGSTLLSVYLANRFSNLKTLLVDLNFSEGGSDTGYYLEIPKTPNMIIFTEGYNRSSLNNSVINIKNNFDVLQSPPTYELSKKLDLQDIYSLVDVARKKYHLMIFDLPNRIDEICLGVLDLADLAVMVTDFSKGSIGRLTDINNRFIYSDLEKILVFNRNKNGNAKYYIKNGLKEFFGVNDIVSLNESSSLCGRSEFDGFNFSSLKEFEPLSEKIMERLTCE